MDAPIPSDPSSAKPEDPCDSVAEHRFEIWRGNQNIQVLLDISSVRPVAPLANVDIRLTRWQVFLNEEVVRMSISLSKGQTLSLAKDNPGLSRVFMGLGWDPVKKRGFLSGLFGGGDDSIDLDASVIVFDAGRNEIEAVYFGNLESADGAIEHDGDNLTGEGSGDDEVIHVDLSGLDPRAVHLVFTVNSFRGQTFNEVENAFARLVDEINGREICSFKLTEQGPHTGVVMASLSKEAGGWVMKAHGKPAAGRTFQDLIGFSKSVI